MENPKLTAILEKIISWGLVILVFLVPLFFLPITSDFYDFNKNLLLLGAGGLLLVLWSLKMLTTRKVTFRRTVFDLPVIVFAFAFIASTLFSAVNKWETLWSPQATGTILSLTVFYFLITNNLHAAHGTRHTLNALTASVSILALVAILQFAGLDKRFTPAGNPLALAITLLVIVVFVLSGIWKNFRAKKINTGFYLHLAGGLILIVGLGLTAWQVIGLKPVFLPYSTSWVIAVETLKNAPLFGVGPAGFSEAFTGFRPLVFNSLPLWATRFGTSGNWYFNLFTTTGVLGLAAFLWLVVKVLKTGRRQSATFPLLLAFVILAFLPAQFLLLFLVWLFLAILALELPTKEYTEEGWILGGIVFLIVLAISTAGFWLGAKALAGEISLYQSLQTLAQNKGTETYNLQIKAIGFNPQADLYRLAYSQTNLALANALATQPNLTDQDKQNISQLVQQAIQEAKTAVSLNPRRVANWENLANIYRSLINFAEGADQWTVASYQQAISLDPLNPNLRLGLGGVYYSLSNYDQAISLFQQSVNLKPDFVNGHYNLAAALREKKQYDQALSQMEVVLALVDPSSGDYQKAKEEADLLREKVKETQPAEAKTPETLVPPAPAPSPVIEPPLQLPEESSPPTVNP